MSPRHLLALLLLILVTAWAGVLRLSALGASLPESRDPDSVLVGQALSFESSRDGTESSVSDLYPHLLGRLLDLLPGRLRVASPGPDASLEEHLAAARVPDKQGRLLIALLSLLVVPLVYQLGRGWYGAGPALFAAALIGCCLTHVCFTRMARPHGPLTTASVASVVALSWALRRPGVLRITAASAVVAFAIGTLHSGAACLAPCLVAACLLASREGPRALLRIVPGLVLIAVATGLFYPWLLAGEPLMSGRPLSDTLTGRGALRLVPRFFSADPVLLGLSALGLVLAPLGLRRWRTAKREQRDSLLLSLAFGLPYLAAISAYSNSWLRFILPLLPFLALLAGVPVAALATRNRGAGIALALGALALPAYASGRYVSIQHRMDSRAQAGQWVQENLDSTQRGIVQTLLSLPIFQQQRTLMRVVPGFRSPWQRYLQRVRDERPLEPNWQLFPLTGRDDHDGFGTEAETRAVLFELRPRFAVLSIPDAFREAHDLGLQIVRSLGAESLITFEPYPACPDGRRLDGGRALEYFLLDYALKAEYPGPGIEILHLNPRQTRR